MRKFLVALILVISLTVCGFSKQYVRTYINTSPSSRASEFALYVNEQICLELSLGSSVISITSILNNSSGSYTIAVIVLYDDGVQ